MLATILAVLVIAVWLGFGLWVLWDMRGDNNAAGW